MKGKTLAILVLVCAIFAYIGLKPTDSKRGKGALENTQPFEEVDLNSVTEVKITKGKDTLNFKKSGDQWRATTSGNLDFPVNFSKFRELLLAVRDLKLESRITRSSKHNSKFGLDEASTPTELSLIAGGQNLVTLQLGKNKEGKPQAPNPAMPFNFGAPDAGQYLNMNEDESVYLIPKPLNTNTTPSNWINEVIVSAKKDEISSIEFHYPHKSFKLDKTVSQIEQSTDGSKPPKEVTTWKASGDLPNNPFDSTKMADLLDDLDEIKVNEPVHKDTAKKFTKDTYQLKVSRGENLIYEVKANKVGNDWYLHNTNNQDEIYKISSFRLEDVFAKNNELFKLKKLQVADNLSQILVKDVDSSYQFNKNGDKWALKGKAPLPALNQANFDNLIKQLKEFDAQDYIKKNIPPQTGKELMVKAGGKNIRVFDLGDFAIKDGKSIQIEGQKLAYALSSGDHEKLFPKVSSLLEFKAPSANANDLKAIKYSDFELKKAESDWQFANGDGVNSNAVDGLWTSYQAIFDSVYEANSTLASVKNTLKLTHSDDSIEELSIGEAKNGFVKIKSSRFGGTFRVNLDVVRSLFNGRMAFAQAVDKTESKSN